MIQKIVKNSDIKFCVDEDPKIQDKFIIKFYTIDKSKAITRTADDVITVNDKRYIKLNWSTIKLLDNGILNYEVNNLDSDADYDDGVYNSTFTRTTYYYLCTDSDGLVDAIEEIELRVDQITTDITAANTARENGDAQLAEKLKNTSDSITATVNGLGNRIDGLNNTVLSYDSRIHDNEDNITVIQNRMSTVETKSTNNENSINTMSTDYAALVSRLEKLEANGTNKPDSLDDRVSALENSKKSLDGRIAEAERISSHFFNDYLHDYTYPSYNILDDDLSDLESRVYALENATQGSNESISSLATDNDNIANRMSVVENRASASETDDNSLVNRMSVVENRASTLATNNDSLVNRVSALENRFQDFDNRLLTLDEYSKDFVLKFPEWSSITQIKNTLGALRYRVEALERGTQGSNKNIPSVATNNNSIANRMSVVENRASASETDDNNIANRMSVMENRASASETGDNSLVNRVSALENSTNDFDSRITQSLNDITSFYGNWVSGYDFSSWLDISNRLTELDMKITALEHK